MFAAILRASSLVSSLAADRRLGPLRARPRPAALSEVRVPLIARRHDLRVDLRQSLGGLLSLWTLQFQLRNGKNTLVNCSRLMANPAAPG